MFGPHAVPLPAAGVGGFQPLCDPSLTPLPRHGRRIPAHVLKVEARTKHVEPNINPEIAGSYGLALAVGNNLNNTRIHDACSNRKGIGWDVDVFRRPAPSFSQHVLAQKGSFLPKRFVETGNLLVGLVRYKKNLAQNHRRKARRIRLRSQNVLAC